MMGFSGRGMGWLVMLCSVVLLAACGTRTVQRAPVADGAPATSVEAGAVVAPAAQQPAGFENAGRAGYYTVKPGDTMIRIGMETGQSWRDIARWNGLTNPNVIEVGQVLRVMPPLAGAVPQATVLAGAKPAASAAVPAAAPVPVAPPQSGATITPVTPSGVTTTAVAPPMVKAAPLPSSQGSTPAGAELSIDLVWPASGSVIGSFDIERNKGIDIAGTAGDPVYAVADARVAYTGAALPSMGNLIILQHATGFITAYGHNQTILVKETEMVRKGQKIGEMGSSGTDRTKLHFEIRLYDKAVDPLKYLPKR